MQGYSPCRAEVFESLPEKLVSGHGPSDHYYAFVAACDLLVRTVQDRKLQAARKSIIVVSPFVAPIPVPVDMATCVRIALHLLAVYTQCTWEKACTDMFVMYGHEQSSGHNLTVHRSTLLFIHCRKSSSRLESRSSLCRLLQRLSLRRSTWPRVYAPLMF
jgi:hypothetical protein